MGQLSQASPTRSPSASVWGVFEMLGQLSQPSPTPSTSASACPAFELFGQLSQTSPLPSPSVSRWFEFAARAQLSQALPTPSPSESSWFVLATVGQLSQSVPTPSPSLSAWVGFESPWQLSQALPAPSRSASSWSGLATDGQLSAALGTPSPSESWAVSPPARPRRRTAARPPRRAETTDGDNLGSMFFSSWRKRNGSRAVRPPTPGRNPISVSRKASWRTTHPPKTLEPPIVAAPARPPQSQNSEVVALATPGGASMTSTAGSLANVVGRGDRVSVRPVV